MEKKKSKKKIKKNQKVKNKAFVNIFSIKKLKNISTCPEVCLDVETTQISIF